MELIFFRFRRSVGLCQGTGFSRAVKLSHPHETPSRTSRPELCEEATARDLLRRRLAGARKTARSALHINRARTTA